MSPSAAPVFAIVLGIMQDAGLPHAGCLCPRCQAALAGEGRPLFAASLGLVDARRNPPGVWLIDVTPDVKYQLHQLAPWLGLPAAAPERLRQPDGLFLTHAHMGHTAGLPALGPEGMNVQAVPLYAAPALLRALQEMPLWRPLLDNLRPHPLAPEQPLPLAPGLTIQPLPVPHRDELGTGTFAFLLRGPNRSLLYLPDLDDWDLWHEGRAWLKGVDIALVDATFYSPGEIGRHSSVPHPPVPETLRFFAGWPGRLLLTHLNHTNPLLDAGSPEREKVVAAGVDIACTGQLFPL